MSEPQHFSLPAEYDFLWQVRQPDGSVEPRRLSKAQARELAALSERWLQIKEQWNITGRLGEMLPGEAGRVQARFEGELRAWGLRQGFIAKEPEYLIPEFAEAIKATREDKAPPESSRAADTGNGPIPPDRFRWQGAEVTDLSSPQWRLLDALCQEGRLRNAAPTAEVIRRVYGDCVTADEGRRRALEQVRRRTQSKLDAAGVRLLIDLTNQSYRLTPT
jgi:hypothetical protein